MPTALGQLFITFGRTIEPDAMLLRQFDQTADEDAFAELVARHGPMVLGVCRRVLRDRHLAEDAFQAVFIVLARRATQPKADRPLGPWLYGVAYRTALGALTMRKKQQQCEQMAPLRSTSQTQSNPDELARTSALLRAEVAFHQWLIDQLSAAMAHINASIEWGLKRSPVNECSVTIWRATRASIRQYQGDLPWAPRISRIASSGAWSNRP